MIGTQNSCLCCSKKGHKSSACKTIAKVGNSKKTQSAKRVCFNCTGVKQRPAERRSKRTCQTCTGKHHSSLCKQSSTMMLATEGSVIYSVATVKVSNIT